LVAIIRSRHGELRIASISLNWDYAESISWCCGEFSDFHQFLVVAAPKFDDNAKNNAKQGEPESGCKTRLQSEGSIAGWCGACGYDEKTKMTNKASRRTLMEREGWGSRDQLMRSSENVRWAAIREHASWGWRRSGYMKQKRAVKHGPGREAFLKHVLRLTGSSESQGNTDTFPSRQIGNRVPDDVTLQ
jgi:hypothetical protein